MNPDPSTKSQFRFKNICVFCSSSPHVSSPYIEAAEELGAFLASKGLTLIYGGCNIGLMGALAHAVKKTGGKVIGVIPKILKEKGLAYEGLDELLVTEGLHERKAVMENMSDAFIVLPGGFGTLDELFEVLALRLLKSHDKPIILINTLGFYDGLSKFFDRILDEHLAKPHHRDLLTIVEKPADLLRVLSSYHPASIQMKSFS